MRIQHVTTRAWSVLVKYRQGAFELAHGNVWEDSFSENSLDAYRGKGLFVERAHR